MGLIALTHDATKIVESQFDDKRGTEEAVKFKIAPVSSRLMAIIKDQSTKVIDDGSGGGALQMNPNLAAYNLVRVGLKSWENFKNSKGELVSPKFEKSTMGGKTIDVLSEDSMDLIPLEVIREIGDAINDFNILSEQEAKK